MVYGKELISLNHNASLVSQKSRTQLVWYWLKQWEEIADQLHMLTWPKRLIPEERAQMFLGYLASFPKSEKPNDNQTHSENMIKDGDER